LWIYFCHLRCRLSAVRLKPALFGGYLFLSPEVGSGAEEAVAIVGVENEVVGDGSWQSSHAVVL
jgi:hypothetical protein